MVWTGWTSVRLPERPGCSRETSATRFRRKHFLDSDKYRGLMVDFEAFPKKGQPGFIALLNELSADLHAKGLKL